MSMEDEYPWVRQVDEGAPQHGYFRLFLYAGPSRSLATVAKETGRTHQYLQHLSAKHNWTARARAWDAFTTKAETDGHADELAQVRNRQLKLTDKLLNHLDARLDQIISRMIDPPRAWTDAFVAATKAQISAIELRGKDMAHADQIEEILRKVETLELGEATP